MQLSINSTQQNPSFGYFSFKPAACNYLKNHMKQGQLERFQRVVAEEAKNTNIEAIIFVDDNDKLAALLKAFDNEKNPLHDYFQNVTPQGIYSKFVKGPIGYLEKVSKKSSELLEKIQIGETVDKVINKASNQV